MKAGDNYHLIESTVFLVNVSGVWLQLKQTDITAVKSVKKVLGHFSTLKDLVINS
jgi:hypothetical protein